MYLSLIVIVTKKSFRFEKTSGGGKVESAAKTAATVRRSLVSNYSHEVDKPSPGMVGLIKSATHAGST